jgi:hypothetical protein
VTIDSRTTDGTSVAVTLSSPDQPEQKKKFAGRLQADAGNANRLLLNLRATQPPPTKAPTEADLKRVIYWSSLLLELRGNSLIGVATAGPPEAVTTLNVAFGTPAAAAPPKPPRSQTPPSQSRGSSDLQTPMTRPARGRAPAPPRYKESRPSSGSPVLCGATSACRTPDQGMHPAVGSLKTTAHSIGGRSCSSTSAEDSSRTSPGGAPKR